MSRLDEKGFSLVELLIVIAIMAILTGVVGVTFTSYIGKSKRTADVYEAKQFADIANRIVAIGDYGTSAGDLAYTGMVCWNKDKKMDKEAKNVAQAAFMELNRVPVSKEHPDYYWTMTYDPVSGYVSTIHIGAKPFEKTHQLYPDGNKYIDG